MRLTRLIGVMLVFGAGAALSWLLQQSATRTPPPSVLMERIREVARLETLEVRLYQRVSFAPDAVPAQSVWGDVVNWVRDSLMKKEGRALVFADVSLGLDLGKLDASQLRVKGHEVEVALPPLTAQVTLRPEDTEVIDSNLDSQQTAQLFALAKDAFERQVQADAPLQQKARASAERSIRALLLAAGFRTVTFVPWPMAGAGEG